MKRFITLEHIQTLGGKKIESITSFNDIIIVNDYGAQPERLILFLKTLTEDESYQLLAVTDHEGSISFLWDKAPKKYRKIQDVKIPDGDIWSVYKNYELDNNNLMQECS